MKVTIEVGSHLVEFAELPKNRFRILIHHTEEKYLPSGKDFSEEEWRKLLQELPQ